MNLKRLTLIFIISLTLIFSIGIISAANDDVAVLEMPTDNIDHDIVSADTQVVPVSQKTEDSSPQKVSQSDSSKTKIKTKVEADQVAVKHKKNSYFKVKVEDKYDDDIKIKNVNLKLKVFTGSKSKTYTVKTNSKGIAKLNTKNLKIGVHKVIISSANDNYEIKKTSKIFVGKQYTATIKSMKDKKVLKNKDVIKVKIKKDDDDDEKEVKIIFKKKAKATKILKAKFYFKNKYTGKVITKVDKSEFDNGKWELPDEDFSSKYKLTKVKVWYISTK